MALLELENVVTAYGKVVALKGLTLRVEPGEIVALLGVDPTVVSPGAIWIIRAVAGHSYRVRNGRTDSHDPRSAASGLSGLVG
jgi:ABC-type branched-subunit amino acid transport system ATPase component